jgi:hypothetical protein
MLATINCRLGKQIKETEQGAQRKSRGYSWLIFDKEAGNSMKKGQSSQQMVLEQVHYCLELKSLHVLNAWSLAWHKWKAMAPLRGGAWWEIFQSLRACPYREWWDPSLFLSSLISSPCLPWASLPWAQKQ